MPDFLILKKNGPGEADVVGCAVIYGKKSEDAEKAIKEGMNQGAGEYLAVSLSTAVRREAISDYKLIEPEEKSA